MVTRDDWRAALLREQFPGPVREHRGPVSGPCFEAILEDRLAELNALGDDVWVLHCEYVRLRASGVPADDVEPHIVAGEAAFRAAERASLDAA
jgi:hypothetical protein